MAKLAGEISGICRLQDPRTASNNSQDGVWETSYGLPQDVDGLRERRHQQELLLWLLTVATLHLPDAECPFIFAFILSYLHSVQVFSIELVLSYSSRVTFQTKFWHHFWFASFNSLLEARRTWNTFHWRAISKGTTRQHLLFQIWNQPEQLTQYHKDEDQSATLLLIKSGWGTRPKLVDTTSYRCTCLETLRGFCATVTPLQAFFVEISSLSFCVALPCGASGRVRYAQWLLPKAPSGKVSLWDMRVKRYKNKSWEENVHSPTTWGGMAQTSLPWKPSGQRKDLPTFWYVLCLLEMLYQVRVKENFIPFLFLSIKIALEMMIVYIWPP